MSADESSIPENIRQKFPHLQPLKNPPSLTTVNGIGLGMYGKRDYDRDTETYVKTRCICLLYLPLFALGAYRVSDAGSRAWYFLGREPLSVFARSWNVIASCLLVLLGLGITWGIHTSSPEYRAQREMKRAADLRKSGQPLAAARIYRGQLDGPAAAAARTEFQDAIEASLQSDQPQNAAGALKLLAGLRPGLNRPEPIVVDPFRRGLELVEKFRAANPEGALDILNSAAAFAPTNSTVPTLRIDLLKQTIAANPDLTNRVVELAVAYEDAGQLAESWKLLRPYQHRLGDTEGARILGQKLMQDGQYADAYELLSPYVRTRLDRLHAVEASFTNIEAAVEQRAFADLKAGNADRSFYNRYDAASESEREKMVGAYIGARMESDPDYQRALAELKEANQIVPAALDLGIVQLNRAQSLSDPAARKTELEAAEKTFLAIRRFADESNEYRLFLGQVYFWLGKSKQGQELFDQLLAANRRAYPVLIALAGTLREVGEMNQARQLCEEAYRTATDNPQRYNAAALRARTEKDNDDEIAWLEKCDPEEIATQIHLNSARGEKAMRSGNREQAAEFFRKADAGYEKMSRNPASLNNHGLVCLNLYRVTGRIEDHNRGLALLQEALSLSPGNSLMLMNVAHLFFTRAYMDVVGDAIRFDILMDTPDAGMLRFLYANEAERKQYYQRLQEDDYFKKAMTYLEKALLLSPKNLNLYEVSLGIHRSLRNLAELQKLQQRIAVSSPDLSENRQDMLEIYSGAKEKEHLGLLQKEILRVQGLLSVPEVRNHPLTLECARVTLVTLQLRLPAYGIAVDASRLLAEARAIYGQRADSATLNLFVDACLGQADQELRGKSAEYARLAEQSRRVLTTRFLIALLLERNHALAPEIRSNPNVLKAADLMKEQGRQFPSFRNPVEWALLRTLDAAAAEALGRQLQADAAGRLAERLGYELSPLNAAAVLEQYWMQKLLGDDKRAGEIYQTAIRDGVPLPPL